MKQRMETVNRVAGGLAMLLVPGLAGCISVEAPEKPIQINLNVTIRQEVVVSLRRDVQDLEQQYPGVF